MINLAFSVNTRGRCWVATIQISNMEKAGLKKEEYENPEYLADFFINLWESSGKERKAGIAVCVSAKGLYHAHMALYGNTTTLKKVANILSQSHVQPQLGGKKALTDYLLKEGEYAEKGEQVLYTKGLDVIQDKQGKRNDLDEIEELLNSGATPKEIFETSFRYRKFEKMIKSAYLDIRINETPLIKEMYNEYHFGKSGTGKTYTTYYKLCEEHSPDEVYLCNDYSNSGSSGGGFDFYSNNPAKIVIMDEFRGNIPYNNLLSILDKYSRNQQHCRFQNTYNLWESVIICSIYPPEKVYTFMVDESQRNIDSMKQFMRRLDLIVYHYKIGDDYKTFSLKPDEYISSNDMINRAMKQHFNEAFDKTANDDNKTNICDKQISEEELKKLFHIEEVKNDRKD